MIFAIDGFKSSTITSRTTREASGNILAVGFGLCTS
jgi:hypothetical protein